MNDFVRTRARALRRRSRSARISRSSPKRPYGKPLVYLDNAASAQKPKAVIDRLAHAYEHEYANVHRGLHYLANAATEAYEAAREMRSAVPERRIGRRDHFHSIGDRGDQSRRVELRPKHIGAGDEIVLSVMEHHSNIVPWHFHRERKGAVLRWVEVERRRFVLARRV